MEQRCSGRQEFSVLTVAAFLTKFPQGKLDGKRWPGSKGSRLRKVELMSETILCRVCSCKSWVEPHTAARRGAEWLGRHPSPVSGVKSLDRTECRGMGRAVDRRVTAAVRSMGSHVAVYLAVAEEPLSQSPSRYVQKPGRAAHCGVRWRRVAQVPSQSCVGT